MKLLSGETTWPFLTIHTSLSIGVVILLALFKQPYCWDFKQKSALALLVIKDTVTL